MTSAFKDVELGGTTHLGFRRETIVTLVVLIVAWEILSRLSPILNIPPFAVPGLLRIYDSLLKITPLDVVVTLARVLAALAISFVVGLVAAIAMYVSPRVDRYVSPFVRLLMAVPVVSWILFAVLWFRWVEFRIAFVLVIVCAPVFLISILDTMRNVPRDLRNMVLAFRPNRLQFFGTLMLPATLPGILTSWKINLSLAIRVVTIAELVGAVTGIGHMLAVSQEMFSVADVFAWTIVIIVLLFILEGLLSFAEAHLLRWRPQ